MSLATATPPDERVGFLRSLLRLPFGNDEAGAAPERLGKWGGDPRVAASLPVPAHSDARVHDWSLGQPGEVSQLQAERGAHAGIEQLQAILDAASACDEMVVLKFQRAHCRACRATAGRCSAATGSSTCAGSGPGSGSGDETSVGTGAKTTICVLCPGVVRGARGACRRRRRWVARGSDVDAARQKEGFGETRGCEKESCPGSYAVVRRGQRVRVHQTCEYTLSAEFFNAHA